MRSGIGLLLLTPVSLLVAGCGANPRTPSETRVVATAPAGTPRPGISRLVAYSVCMRRHGVPNFPDPNSRGNLVITPNARINPASAVYERAQTACKKFGPEGAGSSGMSPAQHAQVLAALTRYVECMRRRAIPMADPFSGPNGGVGISLPRGVDPSSEQYKQADAACKHFIPNGG